MSEPLILASGSEIRAQLLRNACVPFEVSRPRLDEVALRAEFEAEKASPRAIADRLAAMKAREIAKTRPDVLVLGCDQVLDLEGVCLAKPETPEAARAQLRALRGRRHRLLSAAVIYLGKEMLWRHVGEAQLTMRAISDSYLDDYVARNWDSIRHSVGCYKLEEEGVRLFSRIEGDYFTVLGLPLLELLSYLTARGTVPA